MSGTQGKPKVPAVIERFLKALVVANKAVGLYPPSSTIPRDTAEGAATVLREALQERSELRFIVTKQGLIFEDMEVLPEHRAYANFALDLYSRQLAEVRFHVGATARDIVSFLSVLKYTPEEVEASGGFEGRLWEQNVTTITVTDTHVSIVDQGALEGGGETSLTFEELEELLAAARSGRPRERLMIARFVGSASAVARYLSELYSAFEEGRAQFGLSETFTELAEFAHRTPVEGGGDDLMRSLAEALATTDPEPRAALLGDILQHARTNEALASVARRIPLKELCHMVAYAPDPQAMSQRGLARSIRDLVYVLGASREDATLACSEALHTAGLAHGSVAEVLEIALPSHLNVEGENGAPLRPVEALSSVMRLIRSAPHGDVAGASPELEALRAEARRGVTDGDVIMALVTLAALDPRERQFASTMSMLEDSLDLLIERGDLEIAADVTDALRVASESPSLVVEQRRRVERAMGRLSKPADIRAIAHAMRIFPEDAPEHRAAKRLLDALGPLAIEPLLEQLAEEPDMSERKWLVELLSRIASMYLADVGIHVTDQRWYVVRNVVGVLGATRSPAALPFLERTMRHHEVRVRRETIRALSGISDRLVHQMLISVLSDDDPQNVQLAARYLGAAGVTQAVPALEQVARGEGRGSRDSGPRVEAIESLGRLGAIETLPTLEWLAGKRAFIGSGKRTKELRAAAESAIARLQSAGGEGQ